MPRSNLVYGHRGVYSLLDLELLLMFEWELEKYGFELTLREGWWSEKCILSEEELSDKDKEILIQITTIPKQGTEECDVSYFEIIPYDKLKLEITIDKLFLAIPNLKFAKKI